MLGVTGLFHSDHLYYIEVEFSVSIRPLFSTLGRARQNVEKMIKFSNFHENSRQKILDLEIHN